MNSITLCVQIAGAPQGRFTGDGEKQSKVVECLAHFSHGYGERQKTSTITLSAWNGTGEQLLAYQPGQNLLVIGRVDITTIDRPEGFKEDKATVVASQIVTMNDFVQVNSLSIAGNLGRDPEMNYFESGANVAKSSLAVNAGKNRKPNWFSFEAWAGQGETIGNHCHQGDKLGITGELQLESWNDRNTGVVRTKPLVKVDRLSLLGKSGNAQTTPAASYEEEF